MSKTENDDGGPKSSDGEVPVVVGTNPNTHVIQGPPPLAPEWVLGSQDIEIPTLFFQGLGDSQTKLVHYTGSWGFTTHADQHIRVRGGMEVIRFPFVGPEIQEVILRYPGQRLSSVSFFWHPLVLTGRAIANYTNAVYDIGLIPSTCCAPAIPAANLKLLPLTPGRPVLQMSHINLGQDGDIQSHRAKYDAMRYQGAREAQRKRMNAQIGNNTYSEVDIHKTAAEEEEDLEELSPEDDAVAQPCILYGVGRGAAATFNAVATQQYRDIKLVVLEGCFKSVRSAIKMQVGRFMAPMSEMAVSLLTAYNPGGLSPMKLVSKFPTDIPVAFVTSLHDTEVSMVDTIFLVAALRAAGHEKVHRLILQNSRHPFYTVDNNLDRYAYTIWLHALYRLYDLPHVPEYATAGEVLLDETQQSAWFTSSSSDDADDDAVAEDDDDDDDDHDEVKQQKGKEKIVDTEEQQEEQEEKL